MLYLWLPFTNGSLMLWNATFGNREMMAKLKDKASYISSKF